MNRREIDILVIVNGEPVAVKVDDEETVGKVVAEALKESGNSGQPFDRWELRDATGAEIDFNLRVGDLKLVDGSKLFLNLKAGVGGAYG